MFAQYSKYLFVTILSPEIFPKNYLMLSGQF